ncbi:MAG TPA: ubiquinone/menaquinone biosynthesis methyltransferase [Candidatus Binatia bacterium]|nr:ubiquinone/menaquinone biosynthesis methyltransferase [Candidatus Binatia bacterium]
MVRHLTPWIKRWPSDPGDRARYAESIFRRVAPRYDTLTDALSFGQDRRWKRRLADEALQAGLQGRVLDLATGTAALPLLLRGAGHRGPIVGLDRSAEMLALARRKCAGDGSVGFLRGDLSRLPFADRSFDAVTIGYGLRYPPDLRVFLSGIFRLLRPGGRFLSLDFGLPASRAYRSLAQGYLLVAGAFWGLALHGRPGTYTHIVESLRAYPGQRAIAALMNEVGFADVSFEERLGGIAALIRGRRP